LIVSPEKRSKPGDEGERGKLVCPRVSHLAIFLRLEGRDLGVK